MADDHTATDHDDASKDAPNTTPQKKGTEAAAGAQPAAAWRTMSAPENNPEPEARIIEEVITKPHAASPAPPAPVSQAQKTFAPTPPAAQKTSLPPIVSLPNIKTPPVFDDAPKPDNSPRTPPIAASAQSPAPQKPPVQQPEISTLNADVLPPHRETPKPTPPQVAAPRPPVTQAALQPKNPAAPTPEAGGELTADIANILKDVKLPERREAAVSSTLGTPQKTYEVKKFDTILGADVHAEEAKERAAANSPVQKQGIVVPIHTLKDDLQHVVHDQKISVVRAASLEEERKHRDTNNADFADNAPKTRASKRVFAIVFSVIILILLGAGALFGVYAVERARSAPTNLPSASSILFAENTVPFPMDNQSPNALKQILAQARGSSSGALGSITQIVPTVSVTAADGTVTPRPATFVEFIRAIGANPPDELLRSLSSDFFFGIHTVDKQAPLIIVPVTSYDHAFAAMLAWEPSINADFAPIFTQLPAQTTDASGLPTLRTFSDVVMRNYDIRALKDDSGMIEMYYSFPTQNFLVIAESPYTFTEVLSRLQALRKL